MIGGDTAPTKLWGGREVDEKKLQKASAAYMCMPPPARKVDSREANFVRVVCVLFFRVTYVIKEEKKKFKEENRKLFSE